MHWIPTAKALPQGEALLWSGGHYRIGVLVSAQAGDPSAAFMDSRSDELLAWPSHWCELPAPPQTSESNGCNC